MEKLLGEFSFGLFVWQTIILVGLILLLRKFAWKPILTAINDREEGIKNSLQSAEAARVEMENLQADNERILKEARELKQKMIDDAKDEAKTQAAQIMTQAQAAIESEKQAAISELKNQVAEISIGIAEKVTKEVLSEDKKQAQLVQKLLKDVSIK